MAPGSRHGRPAAGDHDASLGDELGAGRGRPQVLPELVDHACSAERPVAVGQHGVLLGRAVSMRNASSLHAARHLPRRYRVSP